jgi:uncharacterized iron-regulated membrane protein
MKLRDILFWGHLVGGVTAGLVILVMAVTGVLLSFEYQIVQWAEKGVRTVDVPIATVAPLSLEALVVRAREAKPAARLSAITIASDPRSSFTAHFGKDGALFVNPYTGAVLGGESKTHAVMHKIEDVHRWLASRKIGKPVTGAANLIFFLLACSGLFLWWPRQQTRDAFRGILTFRPGLFGKARDWNWHNVFGVWCAPVIIIITLTATVMSYGWANNLLFKLAGSPPPARLPAPAVGNPQKAQPEPVPETQFPLAKLYTTASAQAPDWKTIMLRLPQKADGPVVAVILETSAPTRFSRSQLTLDPKSAAVQKWEPYSEASRGRRWRTLARALHTGEAVGIPGQLIAGAASMGGAFLVWTGLSLAWRRFFQNN